MTPATPAHRRQDGSRRPRTFSIGGATFDLFVHCPHNVMSLGDGTRAFTLPLGQKVAAERIIGACGGGASNSAVGLARLGCEAHFSGVVGDDQWGTALLDNLKREGVHADTVTIVEDETSSFSIIFNADGGERVIVYQTGANQHMHDATFPRHMLREVDWVYFNRIPEQACMIENDIVDALTAEGGPKMTWNPGGCQIDMGMRFKHHIELLKRTDLLLLNKEEAALFTKTSTVRDALKKLSAAGVAIACITDGKNGATATDGKNVVTCPTTSATVVDTTGAGDAFGIGMTWGLMSGLDLPRALCAGTINASSVVSVFGAQAGLLTDTEMHERLGRLDLPLETAPL